MRKIRTLPLLLLVACSPPADHGDTGAVDSTSGDADIDYRLLQVGEASGGLFYTDNPSEIRDGTFCEELMEVSLFTDETSFETWASEAISGITVTAAPDWASEVVVTGTLDCSNMLNNFDVESVQLDDSGALHLAFLRHNVDCTDGALITRVFAIIGVPSATYTSASAEWREEMETGCYE